MTESIATTPWLSLMIFLPLIGVLSLIGLRMMARTGQDGRLEKSEEERIDRNARFIALLFTVGTFLVSLFIYIVEYQPSLGGYQLVQTAAWLGGGISYKVGVDGISILFVLLTTFIMPICIIASWTSIKKRVADYMIAFLVLETLILGVFCALDLFVFYIFFIRFNMDLITLSQSLSIIKS